MTVADLGEFGLIAAIRAELPRDAPGILGAGDDGAVLPMPDGRVVASTDLLVEGRHFRLDWSSAADIGVKAAAQNLADIAAMGAEPVALLLGLAVPGELAATWVMDLIRGMVAECERAGAVLAGGDVTSAPDIMLAITALGTLAGRDPVTRAGARPGDVIALSGRPGRSAAGLALLQAGWHSDGAGYSGGPGQSAGQRGPDAQDGEGTENWRAGARGPGTETSAGAGQQALVAAHRRPQPDYAAGPAAAAAGATSMIDVSDGLLADLGHIAEASGVAMDLRSASLPGAAELRAAADGLGADWRDWALGGGEDHVLAASFPALTAVPPAWTVVGDVRPGAGVLVDSQPWRGARGFDHFGKAGR